MNEEEIYVCLDDITAYIRSCVCDKQTQDSIIELLVNAANETRAFTVYEMDSCDATALKEYIDRMYKGCQTDICMMPMGVWNVIHEKSTTRYYISQYYEMLDAETF